LIRIETQSILHAADLTQLLNHDISLKEMLGGNKIITPEEFLAYNDEWAVKHNAQLYAIIKDNIAIGSISLAHIDYETQTASTGYWLSSVVWGNGYATEAFKLISIEAKRLNLQYLTSKIKKDNAISLKIWKKYNPEFQDLGDKWQLTIKI